MKGFIEVTFAANGSKRLVNVSEIQYVGDFSGDTCIIFKPISSKKSKTPNYLWISETLSEVAAKIKEATE